MFGRLTQPCPCKLVSYSYSCSGELYDVKYYTFTAVYCIHSESSNCPFMVIIAIATNLPYWLAIGTCILLMSLSLSSYTTNTIASYIATLWHFS